MKRFHVHVHVDDLTGMILDGVETTCC